MVDGFKCFGQVNGSDDSAFRGFALVDSGGDEIGERKKSGSGGAAGGESMLMRRARKMLQELRTDKAFEKFRSGTEERNRTVGRREVKRLTRFRDREDKGMFPDSGDVSRIKGEVEEGGTLDY